MGGLLVAAVSAALWWRWITLRQKAWNIRLADAIPVHSKFWRERRGDDGELHYVAIGDSTAQGIGASRPAHGYVGNVARHIDQVTGRMPKVTNLATSGATVRIAIDNQLPEFAGLQTDILTVSIGANDMANFDAARFDADIRELFDALPDHAIVADLPSFYFLPRQKLVRVANRLLREAARERGLTVVPLHAHTDKWGIWGVLRQFSGDLFHPNDRGYEMWADTFVPAVDVRLHTLARR